MEKNKPIIISISAFSGGGKTTIIEKLKQRLPNTVSLHFDDYDFECPDEIVDWVQRGADYNEYKIQPFIDDLKKNIASNNNIQWILLDYPFSYVKDDLGQYIDYSIFLDTSLDVALSRRLLRDYEKASSEAILSDIKFYLSHGRICYLEMLKTVKPTCDLIVDGNQLEKEIEQEILMALKEGFSEACFMNKEKILPRYREFCSDVVDQYKEDLLSSNEVERYLISEFKGFENSKKLTGGRISGVYKIVVGGQDRVIKYSKGKYRVLELRREAEILRYLKDHECKELVPLLRQVKIFNEFAYLLQDYFQGITLRELIKSNNYVEFKSKIWKLVGKTLSKIHTLYETDDLENKWLNEQFKIAKLNLDSNLIDTYDFGNEEPEEVLKWLISNKPLSHQLCLLHGDLRTKNIMMDQEYNCKIIDWGFVDVGNPYYDLAVLDYYFSDDIERKSFYHGYNKKPYNKNLIEYFDKLSWFINV